MPASLCKGSSKKVLSSQSVCLLFTRLFNQTTIVVTLYSLSVLNDSVSYLTKLYQSEVKMKKIDIFKHYPPPYRIPLALGRLPRTLTTPSVKKSWIRPCLYILIGAIKFISVRSSQGNLSLFEITRALLLFSRKFQMQFKGLRKEEFFLFLNGTVIQKSLAFLNVYKSSCLQDSNYSLLPITRTLANSNLALTRTKIDFPWISVIHLL